MAVTAVMEAMGVMAVTAARILCLIAMGAVSAGCFGKDGPTILPVPPDPLELVTGSVQTASDREGALRFLEHARDNFTLRSSDEAYDLKVSFTTDSLGQTNYDGTWQMEDLNVPGQGLRWTAKSSGGYSITRISAAGEVSAESTARSIPLRLQEARGLLNDPLPSASYASRGSIRTARAELNGKAVTCLLLSQLKNPANPPVGRGWDEAEECIDPQTGLLQLHSEAPGRYVVYDYSQPFQVGAHVVPRSITVNEAGKAVSKIVVDSVSPIAGVNPDSFYPTAAMQAAGPVISIKGAERIVRVHQQGHSSSGLTLSAVCIFGLITSTGQLTEAHSLQPNDPNSEDALKDAQSINFAPTVPQGAPPQQHFGFIIEKFLTKQ